MKKKIGKAFIVASVFAVLGVIGRLDHQDQQLDASRTNDFRVRLMPVAANLPPLKQACFTPSSYIQHCEANLNKPIRRRL